MLALALGLEGNSSPRRRTPPPRCPNVAASGPSGGCQAPLPEKMIGDYAEPDEKAKRCADEKEACVRGYGSRPASTIRLIAHT